MNPILAHLRALLERALTHAENPAIVRLTESERTKERLAGAYLPRRISVPGREGGCLTADYVGYGVSSLRLDLTDPGTAHALLVALALALGLDPGVGGVGVRWARSGGAWSINADRWVVFGPAETRSPDDRIETDLPDVALVEAPTVAAEPDPRKALVLAVLHVLEVPDV